MSTFQSLGLEANLLQAIEDLGFETPSEVQEKTIPILLDQETDIVSLAQTGTGKTAAFGFPMLQKINPESRTTQGLILSPTRELCLQITSELKNYGKLAEDLGLDVLYEIHTEEELNKIDNPDGKIIGINNRNLNTFKVDLEHSIALASKLPDTCIKVSESGISDPKIIMGLKQYGFQGFLIGENFMKTDNPGEACKEFVAQL